MDEDLLQCERKERKDSTRWSNLIHCEPKELDAQTYQQLINGSNVLQSVLLERLWEAETMNQPFKYRKKDARKILYTQ